MNNPRYTTHFDFDCEGEPPRIYLHDHELSSTVAQLYFDPLQTTEDWSWDPNDWTLPEEVTQILKKLNKED